MFFCILPPSCFTSRSHIIRRYQSHLPRTQRPHRHPSILPHLQHLHLIGRSHWNLLVIAAGWSEGVQHRRYLIPAPWLVPLGHAGLLVGVKVRVVLRAEDSHPSRGQLHWGGWNRRGGATVRLRRLRHVPLRDAGPRLWRLCRRGRGGWNDVWNRTDRCGCVCVCILLVT